MAASLLQPRVYPSNCEPCRRRKCRCNRIKPCSNCELRGISDQCFVQPPRIEGCSVVNSTSTTSSSPLQNITSRKRPHTDREIDSLHPQHATEVSSSDSSSPASKATRSQSWTKSLSESSQKDHNSLVSTPSTSQLPSTQEDKLKWQDVAHHLPSPALCFSFLHFFFDEVSLY